MALIETEGLVLKSYSLAEADKIVVFLTEHRFGARSRQRRETPEKPFRRQSRAVFDR